MKTIFSLILLVFAFVTHAAIINIPDDYNTIQQGVNAAEIGDTVLVQPGTYSESISVDTENLTIASLVLTTGDTTYVHQTIIDQENNNNFGYAFRLDSFTRLVGLTIQNYDNAPFVIDCNSSATLEYLIIQDNQDNFGTWGGIYCDGEYTLTINNSIVRNIKGETFGGGISVLDGASLIIQDSIIENNDGYSGGGICVYFDASLHGENLIIRDNVAHIGGGINFSDAAYSTIRNSIISGNIDYEYGCGLKVTESSLELVNVTICSNISEDESNGGGIYITNGCSLVILNSIVAFNIPYEIFEHYEQNSIFIAYSDIYNGTENMAVNEDSLHWLEGNIEDDPLFNEPENGDYSLLFNSPCIDAGTAFYVLGEDTLINLSEDGYIGNAPDMGYYESNAPLAPLPFNLVSPPDFTPIDSINITLIWETAIDPDSLQDSVRYEVYLAHNPNEVYDNLIAVTSDTSHDIRVEPESIYRWTIKAVDDDGYFRWADELWTFTTTAINDVYEDLDLNVPKNYSIESAWPNPFNSTTEVRIALPENSNLTLSVFNLLGQNVAVLTDDNYTPGYHNFVFDAKNLTSGIYFINASVPGRFNQVNKIVLMK